MPPFPQKTGFVLTLSPCSRNRWIRRLPAGAGLAGKEDEAEHQVW